MINLLLQPWEAAAVVAAAAWPVSCPEDSGVVVEAAAEVCPD
jgi:hypothetical protein